MAIDQGWLGNIQGTYALDLRRALFAQWRGQGVTDGGALDVTQRGAGANMSVDVAGGIAMIADGNLLPGLYPFVNDATANLTVSAADPTDDRIDIVVARVYDTERSDGSDEKVFEIIEGTPDATPAAPATPARCLLLAEINVAAAATSITNAAITEKRVWAEAAKAGRGELATAVSSATDTTSSTTVPGTTKTVTVGAARKIKVSFRGTVSSDVAGDVATVDLQRGGSTLTGGQAKVKCDVLNADYETTPWVVDVGPAAGSQTYRAHLGRGVGLGTISIEANGYFLVEDIGAATIT